MLSDFTCSGTFGGTPAAECVLIITRSSRPLWSTARSHGSDTSDWLDNPPWMVRPIHWTAFPMQRFKLVHMGMAYKWSDHIID
jgi:hypothetical protein